MLSLAIAKTFSSRLARFSLNIAFDLGPEYTRAVFFGPSGSGKTLTMQCIAGLAKPDSGHIAVNGQTLYDSSQKICLPAQKRHIGYMLQDYALFPQLTVLQNVAYSHTGLWARHVGDKAKDEAMACLERFGIAHLADHLPAELSGGQKQRAAVARAVNSRPSLLLLDEPFSALDPLLREQLRSEILEILNTLDSGRNGQCPAVIITHDPEDVDAFAGALILYDHGRARVIADWQAIRARYASAAACLRALQNKG